MCLKHYYFPTNVGGSPIFYNVVDYNNIFYTSTKAFIYMDRLIRITLVKGVDAGVTPAPYTKIHVRIV